MYNYLNSMLPEEQPAWRSASDIEIAAQKHEERRMWNAVEFPERQEPEQEKAEQMINLLSLIRKPLHLLGTFLG